jgi:prepilin-type N-terminal cleavage/methylation domain-containing protein
MNLSLRKIRAGFTLTELLVVIIIVSLLSALTLGALRSGGISAKKDSARSFIVHLSESLLELFEELDDEGMTASESVNQINVWNNVRSYDIRWQISVSRLDARQRETGNMDINPENQWGDALAPFGVTYNSYADKDELVGNQLREITTGSDTESAECLYMIMTQTGYFGDFLETLHATQVADTDGNGMNEFIDPWGTAIRLDFSPPSPPNAFDIQNLPIIHSAGVDQEFGTGDDIMSIDLVNGIFLQ